jgi:hypothetical protein
MPGASWLRSYGRYTETIINGKRQRTVQKDKDEKTSSDLQTRHRKLTERAAWITL